MQRYVKIVLIIVLVIFAIIGVLVTCTVVAVKKGVEHVATAGMNEYAGPQEARITAEGVFITKPITAKQTIVLSGVEWCQNPGSADISYSHSSSCFNGSCSTTIYLNDTALPKDMVIHRKFNGNCVDQTIPDIARYVTVQYESTIGITSDLAKKLSLNASQLSPEKTPLSTYGSYSKFSVLGNTDYTLKYSARPQADEFMLGKRLFKISYTDEKPESGSTNIFNFSTGSQSFSNHIVTGKSTLTPPANGQ